MKVNIPNKCPICEGEITIKEFNCESCNTKFSGDFSVSKIGKLNENELDFVEKFIKCRGSIKLMEKELSISYPTVKNKLEMIAKKMGFVDKVQTPIETDRVLDSLSNGELSVEEALIILKK